MIILSFISKYTLFALCGRTDMLLLCDVFENFRATCMQHYKLDPAHYFSAPGLAWDAMLKMTGVELKLMVE